MKVDMANGSSVDLDDAVFARDFNEALVHQAVVAYQAGSRSGTKAQKSRSDVSGGGAKPWRQKGTGRARAGTSGGPIWRKGGVTFAARPRDYSQKLNKKMYRAAMASILSELVRSNALIVVEDLAVSQPKTKELVTALNKLDVNSVLIIDESIEDNLLLASRNLPHCETISAGSINPVSLMSYDNVVVTQRALKNIEEWLS